MWPAVILCEGFSEKEAGQGGEQEGGQRPEGRPSGCLDLTEGPDEKGSFGDQPG